MKKETVKLVFIILIAAANIILVYTLLNNQALLEQKRDFNNLVEGNNFNVVKVVKDKVARAINGDKIIEDKKKNVGIVVMKPKKKKVRKVAKVNKSKKIIKKQKGGKNE